MGKNDVVFKRKLRDIGNILGLSLPPELLDFIGANKNDLLRMTPRVGKSGKGICIWKEECDQDDEKLSE
jgi:hypothetical protein